MKEVGHDWVSLCWKKPESKGNRASPIITYKVEAWLCGEGAYWLELGRSPIPQFDAFHLKPQRQYYFRVTAKSRKGVECEMMTKGRVDLSKATKMPAFTKEMPTHLRLLKGTPLTLECEFVGEPCPSVRWTRVQRRPELITSGVKTTPNSSSFTTDFVTSESHSGKYTCELHNVAGRVTNSCYVEIINDERLFKSYERAKRILETGDLTSDTFPCFLVTPRDRRIEYGSNIQFMCKPAGSPKPKVKWLKDGEEIDSECGNVRITEADDGFCYLSLDEVTDEDTGDYEAVAVNDIGQISARFMLVVDEGAEEHYPPQFASPLLSQELGPNVNLLLQTKISASPCVAINWYHNGCRIKNSSNVHKFFDRDGNATLAVANQDCSGQYTCSAFNEAGENTIQAHVTVNNKVKAEDKLFDELPTVAKSSSSNAADEFTVKCKLSLPGEVFLATVPKYEARQKAFTKTGEGRHSLTLTQSDDPDLIGRVVYVVARCGVQGSIYPIKTDVDDSKEKRFIMIENVESTSKAKCDTNEPLEAMCRSGERLSLGLGKLGENGDVVVLTRKDPVGKKCLISSSLSFYLLSYCRVLVHLDRRSCSTAKKTWKSFSRA